MTLPIAVLISGTGSNLRAIAEAIDGGRCDAQIRAVLSDRRNAEGLTFASDRDIPTEVVRIRDFEDRSHWNLALTERVAAYEPALVVLAGFMKVVDDVFIDRFANRIINVHPSLLPAFPGANGPKLALEAGVRVSGCTVHVVDRGVDTGPIIAQGVVRIRPRDDVETLHRRIQKVEHELLPRVIDAVASGAISVDPSVRFDGMDDPGDGVLMSLPPHQEP